MLVVEMDVVRAGRECYVVRLGNGVPRVENGVGDVVERKRERGEGMRSTVGQGCLTVRGKRGMTLLSRFGKFGMNTSWLLLGPIEHLANLILSNSLHSPFRARPSRANFP